MPVAGERREDRQGCRAAGASARLIFFPTAESTITPAVPVRFSPWPFEEAIDENHGTIYLIFEDSQLAMVFLHRTTEPVGCASSL